MRLAVLTVFASVWPTLRTLLSTYVIYKIIRNRYNRSRATPLAGPSHLSWLFGAASLNDMSNLSPIYEAWVQRFGPVFRIPGPLGSTRVILTDPRAVAHFYSLNGWTYVWSKAGRTVVESTFGRGLHTLDGEEHARTRRVLSAALSPTFVQSVIPTCHNLAHKLKATWYKQIAPSDATVVDVRAWMDRLALDAVGLVVLSYDFGTLEGKKCIVSDLFDAAVSVERHWIDRFVDPLGYYIPMLWKLGAIGRLQSRVDSTLDAIVSEALKGVSSARERSSFIGRLVRADEGGLPSSSSVVTYCKELLFAGFETVAVILSWSLIELARHPQVQGRLREELSNQSSGVDQSSEQGSLCSGHSYLDAFIHEILRLHPPINNTVRVATRSDTIPLSKPLLTPMGTLIDEIVVCAGQEVVVPIQYMNTSTLFWGPDAREFKPERWMSEDSIPITSCDSKGHRYLLTFLDGHKACMGRVLALAELKGFLSVLVKSFVFDVPRGPETEIQVFRAGIAQFQGTTGMKGAPIPMRISRVSHELQNI